MICKEQIKNTKLVIIVFIGYTKIHHIIFLNIP